MRSNRPSEVVSDGAIKENAGALRAKVKQKRGWSPMANSIDSPYLTLGGRPAPKGMIYEEIANTLG